jgi:hypothetical protein
MCASVRMKVGEIEVDHFHICAKISTTLFGDAVFGVLVNSSLLDVLKALEIFFQSFDFSFVD